MNFEENGVVRADTGEYRYDINCRLLVENGHYISWVDGDTGVKFPLTSAANIGEQQVLDQGVRQAVDVFSPTGLTYFDTGVVLCLKGSNRILFARGTEAPREATEVPMYRVRAWSNYRCITVFEPGLVIMTNESVNVPPAPWDLHDCNVTTNYVLHLRAMADVGSASLSFVPNNTTLVATARQGDWYRVDYEGQTGWLYGRRSYLAFDGTCGRVCQQNAAGTRIQCHFANDREMEQLEAQGLT